MSLMLDKRSQYCGEIIPQVLGLGSRVAVVTRAAFTAQHSLGITVGSL
jgi:hypothetical protein